MARAVSGRQVPPRSTICRVRGRQGDFARMAKGTQKSRVAEVDLRGGVYTSEGRLVPTSDVTEVGSYSEVREQIVAPDQPRTPPANRTMRVDQEVLAELGNRARPFETPNSVLRRVLGLDN